MSAAKKFTARQFPTLTSLATRQGLVVHKVDSKTYQFAPARFDDDAARGLSCEEMEAMERFAASVTASFADYDLRVDARGRFVSVTWRKDSRTESQLNNCD